MANETRLRIAASQDEAGRAIGEALRCAERFDGLAKMAGKVSDSLYSLSEESSSLSEEDLYRTFVLADHYLQWSGELEDAARRLRAIVESLQAGKGPVLAEGRYSW